MLDTNILQYVLGNTYIYIIDINVYHGLGA